MALAKARKSQRETDVLQTVEPAEDSEAESDVSENSEAAEENTPESDGAGDSDAEGNTGWADSIAKVLNSTKPKSKSSVVLSRAKKQLSEKDKTKKEKTDFGFEVEGEIKEEKPDPEQLNEKAKQRKNVQLALRVRPSWTDIERERTLRKVATKGVVQLFNAVRMQQKDLEEKLEEAGPLDSRRDAVLNNISKKKFLDVLMSGNRAKSEAVDNTVKVEKQEDSDGSEDDDDGNGSDSGRKRKSEWNVLRPDFMTNKKIKHWDEDEDDSDKNNSASSEEDD